MKISRQLLFVIGIAFACLITGCNKVTGFTATPSANAPISINACVAADAFITLNGQVTWTGDGHVTTIKFTDPSPFQNGDTFQLNDATPVPSGPLTQAAQNCASNSPTGICGFKYTIVESTGCTKDPIVVVTK